MVKKIFLLSTVMLVLSACVTTPNGQTQVQIPKTVTYGLSGAGIGAVLGTILGDTSKGTKRGAIAGSVVGTAVGVIMDLQERKLKQATAGTGVEVARVADDRILLTMPENITFDTNKYNLKPRSIQTLNSILPILRENSGQYIQITGHADSTGNDAINNPLSLNRAYVVYDFLNRNRISNVTYAGMGARQPVDTNQTAAGRQKNRRVEIELVAAR